MLDQNTTTIIISIITVIGTLVGALGGVFLSNRHTANLEKLKIEREKIKRTTEAVEEVYQTIVRTDDLVDAFAYDVTEVIKSDLSDVERIKEIRTSSVRTKILIRLYLPSLKVKLGEYENPLAKYWNAIGSLHSGKKGETIKMDELREEFSEAQKGYKQSLGTIQSELEKLVK